MTILKTTAAQIKSFFTKKNQEVAREIREKAQKGKKHDHKKRIVKDDLQLAPSGLKFQFLRLISVMIIFNMLVVSSPAAPQTIASGASEFGQDIRYSYLSNIGSVASFINLSPWNPVVALFFKVTGKGKKRQQQIAKVEISPASAVIREGEELKLSAVAYAANGDIVQGVEFEWKAVDIKNSRAAAIPITENTFSHDVPGGYRVKARANGVIGEGFVVVREDTDFRAMKELMEQEKEAAEVKAGVVKRREARLLRPEVLEAVARMKTDRSKSISNSSRMRKADKTSLEAWEKEELKKRAADLKREQTKRETRLRNRDTARNNIAENIAENSKENDEPIREKKRADEGVKFVNSSYKKSSAKKPESLEKSKSKTETVEKKAPVTGGVTITGVNGSNYAYGTINGFYYSGGGGGGGPFIKYERTATKKKASKEARDPGGSYYAELLLYIDGEMGTGTFLGTSWCSQSSCSWSVAIPTTYHDGQQHTLYAYADDEIFTMQTAGPSLYNFTIGTAGPDTEWSNDNNETADDPGVQVGSPPNNGTSGAGSGNFGFSAPIASLPGRNGLDVNLSLNYNSLLWHKDGSDIIYDIDKGSPAPGWDIGFGKIMDMDTTGGAMLEDPNGTRHSYDGDIVGSGSNTTYYGRTTDGAFIDYIVSRTSSGIVSGTAHFPDGTKVTYGAPEDGVIYPTEIKDSNGNFITITYVGNKGPNINTITDTLGRAIEFKYDSSSRLIAINGPGYNGTTQTFVRLHYTQKALSATFSGLTKGVREASPYQLDSIYYPVTKTGYWFGDSDSYSSYGMIAKVKMMRAMNSTGTDTAQGTVTAGTMSTQTVYNYPMTASSLTTAPQYTTKTETWAGMDTSAAVTSYAVNNTASPRTTTITLPNGTKNKTYSYNNSTWNDGMLNKTEFLSPTNAVLSKQELDWEQGFNNAPRVKEVLSTDEKSQTKKQTFTYGTLYNQVSWAYDYGYSNNLLRKTYTTYENSATYRGTYSGSKWQSGLHIFNLPLTTEVQNASSVRESRMDYTYDTVSLTTRSGVSNWDTAYNTSSIKRGNVTQTRTYSSASNLTGAIDYFYAYDVVGNNLTATTNCCQQMTTTYSATMKFAYPDSLRRGAPTGSANQNTSSVTYDFNTGLVKTSTDYNGKVATADYDSIGRPTQVTLSTAAKTIYEYSPNTLTTTQTARESNNTIVSQSTSIANGRGQPQITKLLTGATAETATTVKYDIMGREYQVSNPYPANGSPTKWTINVYDNLSRVTQTTAPDGSTSKTFYNETTKPSSALSTVGSTVRSQDAWGRERWERSDGWGRLVEVVEPDPTGNGSVFATGNMVTSYTFDAVDQLTVITQGSQTRAFKYDSLGRMTRQKLAEQTATINDAGAYVGGGGGALWSDAFSYDDRSNLTQRIDARGVKTNFNYLISGSPDPLNRLQGISFDKTGADTSNGTIHEAADITYAYMTTGDQERIYTVASTGVSTETYAYDDEGRVSNYKMLLTSRASYPLETSYLYDTANRITEVRYPAQYGMSGNPRKTVNIVYDQTSRLSSLTVGGVVQMDQISYNDYGQTTNIRIGGGSANPLNEEYSFDTNTGLMTNQKVKRGATSLMDLTYDYNRGSSNGSINGTTGNLTHIVNNLDRNKDRVYEYDTLGRLIKSKGGAATGVGGVTANWTQDYAYDRYGNKTTTTKSGITANSAAIPLDGLASQTFNAANNRITNLSHEYDNAGNMTRGASPAGTLQKFEYDEAGRIKVIKTDSGTVIETNSYATSRNRLIKETSTNRTYYLWGGSSVIAEYTEAIVSSAPNWAKSYIYAGSRLLSTITKNGTAELTEYQHPDRLGTKAISDTSANTFKEQATLPFGTLIDAETIAATNQKFTSYDRSGATGLDYAVNRTYNAGQSRFTQVDPIGMASTSTGNPQSLNLFAYVQNNPVDFTDPSGLISPVIPDWVYNVPPGCELEGGTVTIEMTPEGPKVINVERVISCNSGGGKEQPISDIPEEIGGGGNPGTPQKKDCKEITSAIIDAFNEVLKRFEAFKQDKRDLIPRGIITKADYQKNIDWLKWRIKYFTGFGPFKDASNLTKTLRQAVRVGYYNGHIEQFNIQKKRISSGLKDYDDNDCNNQLPNRRRLRSASKLGVPDRTRPIPISNFRGLLDEASRIFNDAFGSPPPRGRPVLIPLPGRGRVPIIF